VGEGGREKSVNPKDGNESAVVKDLLLFFAVSTIQD